MAQLASLPQIHHISTDLRDSAQVLRLGTRVVDIDGGEWVYLRGTASVVIGGWVTYDESGQTTLIADRAAPVAVAGTAHAGPGTFGFFQIYGNNSAAAAGKAIATDVQLYFDNGFAGFVDDTDVGTGTIIGALSTAASSGSSVAVWLNYPHMNNAAID